MEAVIFFASAFGIVGALKVSGAVIENLKNKN